MHPSLCNQQNPLKVIQNPCLIPGHKLSKQLVSQHVHVVQDGEVEPGAVGALSRGGFGGARVLPGLLKGRRHCLSMYFDSQTHIANIMKCHK